MYLRGSPVTARKGTWLAPTIERRSGRTSVAQVDDAVGADDRQGQVGHAVLAVADAEADGGAALAVDLDVGERRDAHQIDAGGGDVAAGDGQRLDGLVEGAGADHLDLDDAG